MYSGPCFKRPTIQETTWLIKPLWNIPKNKLFVIVIKVSLWHMSYNKSTFTWKNGWSLSDGTTIIVSLLLNSTGKLTKSGFRQEADQTLLKSTYVASVKSYLIIIDPNMASAMCHVLKKACAMCNVKPIRGPLNSSNGSLLSNVAI